MIIIGEKINGTIPIVKKAIEERDANFIRQRAIDQTNDGAHYLDVSASTSPDVEVETLKWLMDIVQDAVDTPLCIDSPNPRAIEAVFKYAKRPGLINSVSMEGDKCDVIFPLIKGTTWEVIALTCDNDGIPKNIDTRVRIAKQMVEEAAKYDITPDRMHVDPLVIALSTDNNSMYSFNESMTRIKEMYPTIKITSGLSNISFGMPLRKVVNQNFLALATFFGMDSAIMDPCSRDMIATLLATEALMGKDKNCRKFSTAFRQGKIGPVK
ncbi:5-methyltetrahydrofolate--homocysteine methyltransferase [Dehalobacter sp. UNSWDHB]|jgi:Methionine synthase I, cobalamin-binding domain|uniref:methyltetrahydrofolate cobalamin methyltransferase n=1 Tax=unclassified Dehalobacter TaxID=2635733 RepID=UPI00028AAA91|nr:MULTISPECIES: methyltetrahydrofolate cobalamin methyltransferase [unclassified Dehalobacter]AFV01260.1 5-methyltetrahydrofolate--homocysteine methyltransferase [Dehalobacter sp. DCA]AFV04298.1 5-methyltetrahydrofolate--homocysteine methyltransferase [Dehalobacter sp. CF]EQB22810.1 5-methyltetrahydrofolate--homocysteine methyltransferase [Dehalobacter sp. UNSWDHB]